MNQHARLFELIGISLTYPREGYAEDIKLLCAEDLLLPKKAAECFKQYAQFIDGKPLHELEELYTRTFDINPDCALEIGWHLFGEDYNRGLFLVRVRQEMRKYGIEETAELPDHLMNVLAVLGAMNTDDARNFANACVQPAVLKMQQAIQGKDKPHEGLIIALVLILDDLFGTVELEKEVERVSLVQLEDTPAIGDVSDLQPHGQTGDHCDG